MVELSDLDRYYGNAIVIVCIHAVDVVRDTLYIIEYPRPVPREAMIVSFRDTETGTIYDAESTKAARRRLPDNLWKTAQRRLSQMNAVEALHELAVPPGNRLEELKGDRKGQHSIRINDQYRICFVWTEQGPADVEIVDYH